MYKIFRNYLRLQFSYMRRKLKKPVMPVNKDGKVFVHIGCGKINSPEFINVDARPLAHVHVVTDDMTSLSEFDDNSVDLIYMCHILEHIKQDGLVRVLAELKRALKPGGVLRVSVPNIDKLIAVYTDSGRDVKSIHKQLMGGQDHEYNVHYSIFNERYLSDLFAEIGFSEIRTWDTANCEYHDFKDRASRKMKAGDNEHLISLNLEAVK